MLADYRAVMFYSFHFRLEFSFVASQYRYWSLMNLIRAIQKNIKSYSGISKKMFSVLKQY